MEYLHQIHKFVQERENVFLKIPALVILVMEGKTATLFSVLARVRVIQKYVLEMDNVLDQILVLVKLIIMVLLVCSQLVTEKKEMNQMFVEDTDIVHILMFAHASLDILDHNVNLQHVLVKNQQMHPFVMAKENVFLQTHVDVIQDFVDLNVTYQGAD